MNIDHRAINRQHAPYVIAELSANHNGDLERAKAILRQAQLAGASAVKLQTYRADTITLNSDRPEFQIHGGLWDGKRLYDLYEWAHTPWEWHAPLFAYGRELGITVFSSPFDATAVDLLEELHCPAYKIASPELVDLPLIRYAAKTGKPLIMSTGMATLPEIESAVKTALKYGSGDVALLHCISGYPAPAEEYHLSNVVDLRRRFGIEIGLSDHTFGAVTAIAATVLGATIIEKHVTLKRADGGPDSGFSMEMDEFEEMLRQVNQAWSALGQVSYAPTPSEQRNLAFRRSLYAVKAIAAGEALTPDNVRSVRPANGLPPADYDAVMNCRAKRDIAAHEPLSWDALQAE